MGRPYCQLVCECIGIQKVWLQVWWPVYVPPSPLEIGLTYFFSGWRKSTSSASMCIILHAHKSLVFNLPKIGFDPIDSQWTIRPCVPSEAGFTSKCPPRPAIKRTMDFTFRGVYTVVPTYLSAHVIQDVRYLKPHVVNVVKEEEERKMWDNITIARK